MRLNELLTNIKGKIPIILKIDDLEIDALTYFSILKPTNNSSVMALLQSHSPSFAKNKSMKR